MHFTRDQYRQITIHPDGGVTIDLVDDYHVQSQAVSNTEQDAHGLESIWRTDDITFESFIQTLRNQGRVSQHGMRWQGTGTHLRALMDFLTLAKFIKSVSINKFFALSKNTFDLSLKRVESLTKINVGEYERETQDLQQCFFG